MARSARRKRIRVPLRPNAACEVTDREMKNRSISPVGAYGTLRTFLLLLVPVLMPASHLAQPAAGITRENVARLEVAWTYRTGEADPRFATTKAAAFEATPLVADGTMYVGTPLGRVIALDPASGRERWVFDPQIARDIPYGDFANRGVSTWLDEAAAVNTPC